MRLVIEQLKLLHEAGLIYVFALMQMDDLIDKWTIVFSASWLNDENHMSAFSEIHRLIRENLNAEDLATIARIGLYTRDEHLIQELLKFKAGSQFENMKINGNTVYKGILFESDSGEQI